MSDRESESLVNVCESDRVKSDRLLGDDYGSTRNSHGEGDIAQGCTKVYTRRWYILLVFSLMALAQGAIWNTWGPLTRSAEVVFGWHDSDIALLSNWGPITYVVSMAGFSWLMDVKGLRISSIICCSLVFVGAGLRCITFEQPAASWLIHVGHILNGLAGPVSMAGCPLLSTLWFPPNQRTTATSVSAVFNYVGMALSFILGPLMVREPPDSTNSTNASIVLVDLNKNASLEDMKNDIRILMYVEAGYAAVLFLIMLIYFPAKPPMPPSVSAHKERVNFKEGLLGLFKKLNFWIVAIPYGISSGVYGGWGSVLGVNLTPLKEIDQTEAGWIGFYSTIAGCAAGFIVARIADCFAGHIKLFLLGLTLMGIGSTVWLTIVIGSYIPFSTAQLYASCIITGFVLNATIPLFYEMSCETSFPIAEGVTSGLLTFLNNVVALIFLLIFMIPSLPTMWMNWFLVGCVIFCFMVLLFLKENYGRLQIDVEKFTVMVHDH